MNNTVDKDIVLKVCLNKNQISVRYISPLNSKSHAMMHLVAWLDNKYTLPEGQQPWTDQPTHLDSSDQLLWAHVMQCRCGYGKLEYP